MTITSVMSMGKESFQFYSRVFYYYLYFTVLCFVGVEFRDCPAPIANLDNHLVLQQDTTNPYLWEHSTLHTGNQKNTFNSLYYIR